MLFRSGYEIVFTNLPHFVSQFRSLEVISQLRGDFAAISKPRGDFAAKGHFRNQGAFSQPISQPRGNFIGVFASHFAAAKWGWGAAKWHLCAKGVFTAAKIFAEGSYRATRSFRSGGPFSQPTLDFAMGTLWLRKYFAEEGHFCRVLFWAGKFCKPLNFLGFELL